MSELTSKEPVFPDYLAKWSRVNLVAHEQERSAREEHARDWSAWARSEIARLQRLIARVVEWQPPFPVEASLLDELASAAKGVSTHEPPAPASKEKVSSGTLRSLLRGCHPEQPLASQFVATHILRAMCEELLTHRPEHRCGVQGFDPMRDKCPACSPDEPRPVHANVLQEVSSEWETTKNAGEVTCHSRMIEGVLCRWWGDGPAPAGVDTIDRATQPPGTDAADAARYRWLREKHEFPPYQLQGIPWPVHVVLEHSMPTMQPCWGQTLDAMVDAQMASSLTKGDSQNG